MLIHFSCFGHPASNPVYRSHSLIDGSMHQASNTRTGRPTLGVIIRFKNSAATLPSVLEALKQQTMRADLILGVNNQSTDHSVELLRTAGAKVIEWTGPYHHSRVLNYAIRNCPTDFVLVLSSHTVLRSQDAIEKLIVAMADPRTACASAKWDEDPFYSDEVDWRELQDKGLKFGSIYSNSMGMLRRALWQKTPFDESMNSMEDSAWALDQLRLGMVCRRVDFRFDYQRTGRKRDYVFAITTFKLASRHGLRVAWLGLRATLVNMLRAKRNRMRGVAQRDPTETSAMLMRLKAWAFWRFVKHTEE